MWNERNWTLRQLKSFESVGSMLAFLPKKEQWDYNKKTREESGTNPIEVELIRAACDELHDKEASIACIMAPLTDEKRDGLITSPFKAFPELETKQEGTPIYTFSKDKKKIHQFPLDLSLPENSHITHDPILLWVKYWQLKDQWIPRYQNDLYSASAAQSLGLYDKIEKMKKELKAILEVLEKNGIQVRKAKEAKTD